MPYKNQAIIGVLTGEGDADSVIKNTCLSLAEKWSNSHNNSYDNCHSVYLQMQNIVEASLGRYKPNWNDGEMVKLLKILPQVNETWRLYICGHGTWQTASCGDVRGQEMAKLLLEGGLREVGLISLVACRGAYECKNAELYSQPKSDLPGHDRRLGRFGRRGSGEPFHGTYWFPPSETGFLHCFAGDFHNHLGKGFKIPVGQLGHLRRLRRRGPRGTYWYPPSEQGKDPPSEQGKDPPSEHVEVRTMVYARVGVITTVFTEHHPGLVVVREPGVTSITGRKMTEPKAISVDEAFPQTDLDLNKFTGNEVHKRPESKVAYTWDGDKQVRRWVNYNTAALFGISLPSKSADDDDVLFSF
jgi:hypothetical protein